MCATTLIQLMDQKIIKIYIIANTYSLLSLQSILEISLELERILSISDAVTNLAIAWDSLEVDILKNVSVKFCLWKMKMKHAITY